MTIRCSETEKIGTGTGARRQRPLAAGITREFMIYVIYIMNIIFIISEGVVSTAQAASPPVPPWQSTRLADHSLVGTVHFPNVGPASPTDIVAEAAQRSFVILGERHDNPDHHHIQAWLLRELVATGWRPAVVFEMFTKDDQAAIDAYLAKDPKDAAGLGKAVDWGNRSWPDWSLYQPIADVAVVHDLPIIAGNVPRGTVDTVMKKGGLAGLPDKERSTLRLATPVSMSHLAALRRDIRDGHCDMLPEEMIAPMAAVQRLRDATLAKAMVDASKRPETDGAVLITGTGHARRDRGVPFYLMRQGAASDEIYSIAPIEVEKDLALPADYEKSRSDGLTYDAVWFTPQTEREDPCAQMRQ